MEYFESGMFENFSFEDNELNTEEQICIVETQLEIKFQKEYRYILKLCNGGSGDIGENYIDLWNLEDIVDFYEDNVGEAIKDLVFFASDGCGMAYAFRKSNNEIRCIPMDSLEYECSKKISDNFYMFIKDMYLGSLIEW